LFGYEIREYLLEKWSRRCAYCDTENTPLEIDHIRPRSKGGSDRVSNLTLACRDCNQRKGNQDVKSFLTHDPKRLARIQARAKSPLKDAAAVNSTRWAILHTLKETGLPVETGTGGRTKYNRGRQGYPKAHWIDAACTGRTGYRVNLDPGMRILSITAKGHGGRRVTKPDRYGFPRGRPGRIKRVFGFSTGDIARLRQPNGKYAGVHEGRLAGIRADGRLDIQKGRGGKITANWKKFALIQRSDGYDYDYAA